MLIISGNHLVSRCPQGLGGAALREELPAQKKGRPEASPEALLGAEPSHFAGGLLHQPKRPRGHQDSGPIGSARDLAPGGVCEHRTAHSGSDASEGIRGQQAFLLCLPSFFLPLSKDRNTGWAWVAPLVKCPDS